MYQVDGKDRVKEITDIPYSSAGAPIPVVIAGEHSTAVAFYAQDYDPQHNGTSVRMVDADTTVKQVVIVRFEYCYAHMFGPPNDEAFSGHPLYGRGLRPYANFEIKNSSWIRAIEKMNAVHPFHNKRHFYKGKRHFVLAFHDSTFECVAEGYTFETVKGSIREISTRLGAEIDQ